MMVPIVDAVVTELEKASQSDDEDENDNESQDQQWVLYISYKNSIQEAIRVDFLIRVKYYPYLGMGRYTQ